MTLLLTFASIVAKAIPAEARADLPRPGFSSAAEGFGTVPAYACAPQARAGTAAFANLLEAATGYSANDTPRPCAATWGAPQSLHKSGRAIDFTVNWDNAGQRADGQAVLNWLFANNADYLRRLGVVEIIWGGAMWTTRSNQGNLTGNVSTWPNYTSLGCTGKSDTRASMATECHRDHIHFTLSVAGSEKLSTWWAGSATPDVVVHGVDTIGARDAGNWYLNNQNDASAPDQIFLYGEPGDTPVVGDWNGDGVDTIGVQRGGYWYLNDQNDASAPEHVFLYGEPYMTPVVGDWNGDGVDTVGARDGGSWYLNDQNDASAPDQIFLYGEPGDTPVVGDWNGDGVDTIGIRRGGSWQLNDQNDASAPDRVFLYGEPGDTPVVGDWNGDGVDTIGIRRGGYWQLNDYNDASAPDQVILYGEPYMTPVVGDWNGA